MSEPRQKIVAEGKWLYDRIAEKPVFVIEQNYDYWFEMEKADGDLDPGEKPQLNEHGLLYYLRFTVPEKKPWSVDSVGFKTLEEAKLYALQKVQGQIRWIDRQNDAPSAGDMPK